MACGGVNVLYSTMCHPSPSGFASFCARCPQISPTSHYIICHFATVKRKLYGTTRPTVSARSTLYEVVITHNRSPSRGVSFPSGGFLSYAHDSLPLYDISQRPDGVTLRLTARHFDKDGRGGDNLRSPNLDRGYEGCLMLFPRGECSSAAGHMNDQRHSGAARSHQCLLSAGWVMESRANRWAADRAGMKRALSENKMEACKRGLKEYRKERERKRHGNP